MISQDQHACQALPTSRCPSRDACSFFEVASEASMVALLALAVLRLSSRALFSSRLPAGVRGRQ